MFEDEGLAASRPSYMVEQASKNSGLMRAYIYKMGSCWLDSSYGFDKKEESVNGFFIVTLNFRDNRIVFYYGLPARIRTSRTKQIQIRRFIVYHILMVGHICNV